MKRLAFCGVSARAVDTFIEPLTGHYSDLAQVVALLDVDPRRFEVCAEQVPATRGLPTYGEHDFDKMVAETKPTTVLVASVDGTHARYVLAALKKNLDVVVEKPMTTTAADAVAILEAEKRSKGKVTVTHNARYVPACREIKRLIVEGRLGQIVYGHSNWFMDTLHGTSYFQRWNRKRANSGGLELHKSSHHLDLLNWWLAQDPVEVFAFGGLKYYGPNGPMNPRKVDGRHCTSCPDRPKCAYIMRWDPNRHINPNEKITGQPRIPMGRNPNEYGSYKPDACIFDSEIDIEDHYVATIRYSGGTVVTYSSGFSQPYSGYEVRLNGTLGCISTATASSRGAFPESPESVDFMPLFGHGRESISPAKAEGGHGGSDPLLLDDILVGPAPLSKFPSQAGTRDGVMAVAVGEAIHRSIAAGKAVKIVDLVGNI